MKRCLIFLCVATSWLFAAGVSATPAGFTTDFEAAQKQAVREGKFLFVNFGGSDWCAACIRLEREVFLKPEFIALYSKQFVLVDIDRPMREPARRKFSAAQLQEFEKLRARYHVIYFPSVFLMDARGVPYALTTYKERGLEAFSAHLDALIDRSGTASRAVTAALAMEAGDAKATALAEALSGIDSDLVMDYYSEAIGQLDDAARRDPTGYLTYLRQRKAFRVWEYGLLKSWDKHPLAASAAGMMAALHPAGVTARQILILQFTGELQENRYADAVGTARRILAAQDSYIRWDEPRFFPLEENTLAGLEQLVGKAARLQADGSGEMHKVFEELLHRLPEDPLAKNCATAEHLRNRAAIPLQRRYGEWLLASTQDLPADSRAQTLAKALAGTRYYRYEPISTIVELIRQGSAEQFKRLPDFYQSWPAG